MRHPLMPSSVIRSYRYDPVEHHLDLVFVSGRRYRYHEVPEETYDAMRRAFSKGEFFNRYIRDQYRFSLVNSHGSGNESDHPGQPVRS